MYPGGNQGAGGFGHPQGGYPGSGHPQGGYPGSGYPPQQPGMLKRINEKPFIMSW